MRGRAAVLWGLALFVFSQVGLRLFIERARPELRDPTFEIKYQQLCSRIADHPAPPLKVLFFGSSLTTDGIKAATLEEALTRALSRPVLAYNFGIYCSGPLSQRIYLRRLIERGVRPDLAIIELTPLVHDCHDRPTDLPVLPPERLARGDLPIVEPYAPEPGFRAHWVQSFLVPIYGHRLSMLSYGASFLVPYHDRLWLWPDMDTHGWVSIEVPGPERRRAAEEHVRRVLKPRMAEFRGGAPPMRALVELLDYLKSERVPALLVLMPEGPLLRSAYPGQPLAKLLDEFAALGRKYDFPLVNARDWFEEHAFADSHHLTREGAQRLTDRLGREVLVPLLQKRELAER